MAFATTDDIAARLEVSALTTEQEAAADQLLDSASALVSVAAGKSESAITTDAGNGLAIAKGLTIELVWRAMANSSGLSSASETLGEYTRSETYRRDLSLLLTDAEKLILRQAIHGRISDSVMLGSQFQEVE